MPFNKIHVQYTLAQFDRGVPPHQILADLQYRDFLPSINVGTIERCLRDNDRVLKNDQEAGKSTQGNSRSGQSPTGDAAMGNFATGDDRFVDPGPTMQWDARADAFALAAYRAKKSGDEIWAMLRSNGYDITRAEVVINLVRQGEKLDEILRKGL